MWGSSARTETGATLKRRIRSPRNSHPKHKLLKYSLLEEVSVNTELRCESAPLLDSMIYCYGNVSLVMITGLIVTANIEISVATGTVKTGEGGRNSWDPSKMVRDPMTNGEINVGVE